MTELKTLKDFGNETTDESFPNYKFKKFRLYEDTELKAEAVKWVKFYQKHDEETEEAAQWLRMWIVKFFNLTSEDLK